MPDPDQEPQDVFDDEVFMNALRGAVVRKMCILFPERMTTFHPIGESDVGLWIMTACSTLSAAVRGILRNAIENRDIIPINIQMGEGRAVTLVYNMAEMEDDEILREAPWLTLFAVEMLTETEVVLDELRRIMEGRADLPNIPTPWNSTPAKA